jgi:hypothetical protein
MMAKIFDTLADMGIWIRFHDKRTEPPSEEGRDWGSAVDGLALSLARLNEDSVSVLIKNLSEIEKRATIPAWLGYLHIDLTGPDGLPVPMKPYGKQLMESPQTSKTTERDFLPGKYLATDIPIGALYDLKAPGTYRVRVWCPVPGQPSHTLTSNEITISI